MKVCSKCDKPGEFGPDQRNSDKLQSQCRVCRRTYQHEFNKTWNKLDSVRDYKRNRELKQYWPNITSKEARQKFNELFTKQNGCCAICERHQSEFKKALHVDHDHKTKVVRGLLCASCNQGIGHFKEDPDTLTSAMAYLNRSKMKLVSNENN